MYLNLIVIVVFGQLLIHSLCEEYKITILHNNDLNSHFPGIGQNDKFCLSEERSRGECFGGAAKLVGEIKKFRSTNSNVLVLNAGNNLLGPYWWKHFKTNLVADFFKHINYDAIGFGKFDFHHFDRRGKNIKNETVSKFLREMSNTTTFLKCNNNVTEIPTFQETVQIFTVVEVGFRKIGIFGYDSVHYYDFTAEEISCFRDAIRLLKNEGINIIIGLGSAGFDKAKKLANLLPDIDLIVSGKDWIDQQTFLRPGPQVLLTEDPVPTYPFVVNNIVL